MKIKRCPKCKRDLNISKFHRSSKRKDGYQLWCKDCGLAAKRLQYRKNRREAVTLFARKYILKKYGLELKDYLRILNEQNGVCAICGNKETQKSNPRGKVDSLRVDHDHKTGKIRGLLCAKCNFGIAQFNDSISLLQKAIKYLNGTLEKKPNKS